MSILLVQAAVVGVIQGVSGDFLPLTHTVLLIGD